MKRKDLDSTAAKVKVGLYINHQVSTQEFHKRTTSLNVSGYGACLKCCCPVLQPFVFRASAQHIYIKVVSNES